MTLLLSNTCRIARTSAAIEPVGPPREADQASTAAYGAESLDVILIEGCTPETMALATALRACGLNVYFGTDCSMIEEPLLVVRADALRSADCSARLDAARRAFAAAPVCVLLDAHDGTGGADEVHRRFGDARDVISAAGIRFVSVEPAGHRTASEVAVSQALVPEIRTARKATI